MESKGKIDASIIRMMSSTSTGSETPLLTTTTTSATTSQADQTQTKKNYVNIIFHIISSSVNPNILSIVLGPLLTLLICLFVDFDPANTSKSSRNMLAVGAWIFSWWMTEAVPVPVTSMSPLFLFPLFGISSADVVAKSYMDDVISLVLGTFILALAIEHYNIHRRLALYVTMMFCGDPIKPGLLLLGICGTTFFVSMWMHNVSCAMMMMPVATGILQRLPTSDNILDYSPAVDNYCRAVILGVVYATPIGGMSTLTGTGVNLILVGMWNSYFPEAEPISFSTWSFFAFPFAFLMFWALWAILFSLYCSKGLGRQLSPYLNKNHLKADLQLLGPISFAEKMVLSVFSVLILLWMTRNMTRDVPGWGSLFDGKVGDGSVSVMMATLLFIIPNKKQKGEKLMDWNKCKKLPWNIILLLGAGFAIAEGVRSSGLADILSKSLDFLETAPYWAIAPSVCLVGGFLTEFTSNNSTTTLLVPLLIQAGKSMGVHPLLLMVPGAIGAQFSYLLPTGTPSNVIGFTTGHIQMKDMIKTGLPLKIVGTLILSILMPTLGAYVFGTDGHIPYPLNWRQKFINLPKSS